MQNMEHPDHEDTAPIDWSPIFLFDVERLKLRNAETGRQCALTRNEALLLEALVNGVCAKCDLIDAVWTRYGTVVTENSYYQLVSLLRKSFASIDLEGLVVTLPRKGLTLQRPPADTTARSHRLGETPRDIVGALRSPSDKRGYGLPEAIDESTANKPVHLTDAVNHNQIASACNAMKEHMPSRIDTSDGEPGMRHRAMPDTLNTPPSTPECEHSEPLAGMSGDAGLNAEEVRAARVVGSDGDGFKSGDGGLNQTAAKETRARLSRIMHRWAEKPSNTTLGLTLGAGGLVSAGLLALVLMLSEQTPPPLDAPHAPTSSPLRTVAADDVILHYSRMPTETATRVWRDMEARVNIPPEQHAYLALTVFGNRYAVLACTAAPDLPTVRCSTVTESL